MTALACLAIGGTSRSDAPLDKLAGHGTAALSDAEILAVVLGSPGRAGGVDLARRLLDTFDGIRGVARCGVAELAEVPGIGTRKALRIRAALGLAQRLGEPPPARVRFRSAHEVYLALREAMVGLEVEVFVAMLLDSKGRRFATRVISQGSLSASLVHPREVFNLAIRERAAAMIVAHNHPSGDPTPSPEDIEISRRLRLGGDLLGIRISDSIVISAEGYASLAEMGWP